MISERMTLPELRAKLSAMGFTHVQTFGPILPLAEWTPYGKERVNDYLGRIRDDGKVVDATHEDKMPAWGVNGVWSFLTAEQAADEFERAWDAAVAADLARHHEQLDAEEAEREEANA